MWWLVWILSSPTISGTSTNWDSSWNSWSQTLGSLLLPLCHSCRMFHNNYYYFINQFISRQSHYFITQLPYHIMTKRIIFKKKWLMRWESDWHPAGLRIPSDDVIDEWSVAHGRMACPLWSPCFQSSLFLSFRHHCLFEVFPLCHLTHWVKVWLWGTSLLYCFIFFLSSFISLLYCFICSAELSSLVYGSLFLIISSFFFLFVDPLTLPIAISFFFVFL